MIVKFITSDTCLFLLLGALNHNLLRGRRLPRTSGLGITLLYLRNLPDFTQPSPLLFSFHFSRKVLYLPLFLHAFRLLQLSLFTFDNNNRENALVFLYSGGRGNWQPWCVWVYKTNEFRCKTMLAASAFVCMCLSVLSVSPLVSGIISVTIYHFYFINKVSQLAGITLLIFAPALLLFRRPG